MDATALRVTDQFARDVGRFDVDLGIAHHFCGGVYAREMRIPKGVQALSHAHAYDHMSILALGAVKVETDAVARFYQAPAVVFIHAHEHHRITAIEDSLWYCIHATDETDAARVDRVLLGAA